MKKSETRNCITRTLSTTQCIAHVFNGENREHEERLISLDGDFKDLDKLHKKVAKMLKDENVTVLYVSNVVVSSAMYAMSYDDFRTYGTLVEE